MNWVIVWKNLEGLNHDFCVHLLPSSECPESGIFENTLCTQNSTASVSFPHLMYAHPKYTKHIRGLTPDPQAHSFYLDVDPVSAFSVWTFLR